MQVLQVHVDYFRVDVAGGFSMPRLLLRDRRDGRNSRPVQWVFQRHMEMILYNRWEGGTSGAIYKLLNATGMQRSAFNITRATVDDSEVTQAEFDALLDIFRKTHPNSDVDNLTRVRNVTLLPVATAAAMARTYGHAQGSMAFLTALGQQVPRAWELEQQRAELAERQQVDLVIEEELAAAPAEVEEQVEKSFADELMEMAVFTSDKDDEARIRQYSLKEPSTQLLEDLDTYIKYRCEPFEARRSGVAVVAATAEHDKQGVLRFLGWLKQSKLLPRDTLLHLQTLAAAKMGDWVQAYTRWLRDKQKLRCSSISNYLNSLAMVTQYVYDSGGFVIDEAVTNAERTPLTMILNLRDQAEKESKTEQLYTKRVGGFITWQEAQEARVRAVEALAQCRVGSQRLELLKGATALSLLTLIPPDRVGVIRKLRVGHTLKRFAEPAVDGAEPVTSWGIDLSKQRNAHKTAKFYGPYAAKLPRETWALLTNYVAALGLEVGGDQAYLFHPKTLGVGRPMETSQWTLFVRQLFGKWHGTELPPKALRSSFITWLRDSTQAPEILKSAAHAMKHRPEMQASDTYDGGADSRLVAAAFEFNSEFASQFTTSTPLPTPTPPPVAATAQTPGWIGDLVAKRGAVERDMVAFSCIVPWTDAFKQSQVVVFPKVPTRSGPFKIALPYDEATLRGGVSVKLHMRASFRPSSTTLKGVYVAMADALDDEESDDDEEEEAEDEVATDQWSIETVLDARRGKRGKLELKVKWGGVDEDGNPWPHDWIPASWATPAAKRDGERLLRESKATAEQWQQAIHEGEEGEEGEEEEMDDEGGELDDDPNDMHSDAEVVEVEEEEEVQETSSGAGPSSSAAGSSSAHAQVPPPPSSPPKRTRSSQRQQTTPQTSQRAPTPVFDEMDIAGLTVGQTLLARTIGPTGEKLWFQAIIRGFRNTWPPIVVEYTGTESGDTTRLNLPQLLKGFVWKADITTL